MSTEKFYSELPEVASFIDATNSGNFVSIPNDWYVIITDIVGSTKAIEAGRYKDVNLLGACSIAAVLNVVGDVEVPYVFGGDGASILIPASLLHKVKPVLRAVQRLAETEFKLHLRVGFVPVSVVTSNGHSVKVTKLKLSDDYSQAMFMGGGLSHATDLVKAADSAYLYQLEAAEASEPNFFGLECRWQDIISRHGEIVSLLVLARATVTNESNKTYQEVIQKIYEIYGSDNDFHPIAVNNLKLALNSNNLLAETRIRAYAKSRFAKWLYLSQVQFENLLGLVFMGLKMKIGGTNWGVYKGLVTATSDYKKFDDMLRMVIAGNAAQREKLAHYLESQLKQGKLVYGLHVSNRALMTCLVFERNGCQVHFVDGADGGYALAAKPLKQQMQRVAANWKTYSEMAKLRQRSNVTAERS